MKRTVTVECSDGSPGCYGTVEIKVPQDATEEEIQVRARSATCEGCGSDQDPNDDDD
ncbi:MAG: hypothetical protein K0Q43_5184 [Ramlibacter sp.]|jgi:hypothetical protein|nr:hypothetical protein [Ramlibacter sp.]MDF2466949.1 hypothetical protein [Ramlibacter sp.]